MKENNNEKIIKSVDSDGNDVEVMIIKPTTKHFRDSQIAYNKAFREALDSGALLRQKLNDYMIEQGIWSEAKQKKNDEYVEQIRGMEDTLKAGGIKLSDAKEMALRLKGLRLEFQVFLAEKNALDSASVEGQADNARFAELLRLCIVDKNNKTPLFKDEKSYEANATEPWVVEASSQLANLLYGLDPNYANNLEENKFLKEFNFINENLQLINDEGHLVDADGRLINEDGRFIAYRTEEGKKNKDQEQVYFVNRDGQEVVCITDEDGNEDWVRKSVSERKPFLDDGGNPILNDDNSEQTTEEPAKPKRKKRENKTETETA